MNNKDSWKPSQYNKFSRERFLPFFDLFNLIKKRKNMKIIDLGCGDGNITKTLHQKLKAKYTLGIEKSENMFKEAIFVPDENISFKNISIENFIFEENYDLIFANASLHWLKNQLDIINIASKSLYKRGQIAFQIPANNDYPTHTIAKQLEGYFSNKFSKNLRHPFTIYSIEEYSKFLFELGFKKQIVRSQVYGHILEHSTDVLEWVKGAFLTWYEKELSKEEYLEFISVYKTELFKVIPNQKNFYYPMKRIFIWGEK